MLGHADMLTMGCPQEVTLLVLVKTFLLGFPGGSVVRNPPANVGDAGSIPGLRRCPGEGNGNPLQYSCLENPMDRGAWQATVHEIAKSQTQLSTTTSTKDTACCNLDLVQPNFKKKRHPCHHDACNEGVLGSSPGLGRSPGGRHGNPLQYSCLENPTDREAWWATVHRVAKSQTELK